MASDKKNMPPTPYRAIRKVILASMILLPFIPFILSVSTGYYYFTTALKTNTLASLERIVADHRQMIEFFLQERKADLAFIVQSYGLDDLSRPAFLKNVFARLRQKSDAFYDLGVFDAHGLHLAYEGPYSLTGKRYQDTVWFQRVLQQGDYISDVFLGYRQTPHFIIALVGQDPGNQWVIRATIDTAAFNDLGGQGAHRGHRGGLHSEPGGDSADRSAVGRQAHGKAGRTGPGAGPSSGHPHRHQPTAPAAKATFMPRPGSRTRIGSWWCARKRPTCSSSCTRPPC